MKQEAHTPVRVLQVVTTMDRAGIETMLMNYYRHIDRSILQFDFLEHRAKRSDYDDEIEALGGKIYRLPRLNPLSKEYLNALDKFFSEHPEYRIVHSHLDCMAGIPLKYAKKHGVPTRIAHAHNSNQNKNFKYPLKLYYKQSIPQYATDLFACGQEAGKWMYGNHPFSVLNNAIDVKHFSFNKEVRKEVRNQLGIDESTLVLGHVGRFNPQKNHTFLIDIFNAVHSLRPDSKLLLVGQGELEKEIREKCNAMGILDHVVFTGSRSDVNRLLQAMDVFMQPSLFEGLSVAAIEAQAAGLPCLISDKVPMDCEKTEGLVCSVPLDASPKDWAEKVLKAASIARRDTYPEISQNGFDIIENAEWLQNFYLSRQSGY